MSQTLYFSLWLLQSLHTLYGSILEMHIFYPESALDFAVINSDPYNSIFYLWIYSCEENHIGTDNFYTFGTNVCPGGEINRNNPVPGSNSYFLNYTVSSMDRVSENNWVVTFDLGDSYLGTVWVALTSVVSGYGNSVPACSFGNGIDTNPLCSQIGVPWVAQVVSTSQTIPLYMFPAFGDQQVGVSKVLFTDYPTPPNFYSYDPSATVKRDISVYIPPTMLQNNISRAVNVMIVNDGSLSDLQTYALYGFQEAVLTGVIPETIMIGVPQSNGSSTRQYELVYNQCDYSVWGKYGNEDQSAGSAPVASAYYGCPTSPETWEAGGNDAYLQWVNSTIIPAVLKELGFSRHETAIMGGSYGGLSSLYGPSKYPSAYNRGYSFAGAVQWNFGEMASVISENYKATGMRPAAVVMELGHEAYDVFQYYPTKEKKNLLQLSYSVYEAWLAIGMNVIPWDTTDFPPTSQNSYLTAIPGTAPSNTISFYYQRGAIHMVPDWEVGLSEGLALLYRSNFPAVNNSRLQRSNNLQFVSLPSVSSDDDDDVSAAVIGLSVALSVATVALIVVSFLLWTERKKKENHTLKEQLQL